ncbi:hypothetical protein O1611_g129 [Lasiodiplodia mahajangana]|uniref:Uncharacterized protein n=1 Tax=Lasiodiplodia mahajangana TaxID=1108764 RepID=A0ACC2K1G1_9PEZI|nr:hypothetical protein O1611_g129 [Lasiodiplodia mahajangana]
MANEGGLWSHHQGGWNVTKLVLRCLSFVLSIVIIGLSVNEGIRLSGASDARRFYTSWWFTLPLALISIGVDGAELIFGFLWKRNPGIHPGWHIGIELVLLGGNIVALIFISSTIPGYYGYYYDDPNFARAISHLLIVTVAFVGIFTVNRFILFVIACVDTHRYHTAAQVQLIVQTLRQQNLNDPATAAIIHQYNSLYPANYTNNPQHIPIPDHPQMARPPYEPSDEVTLYPELPENQKFLADLRPSLK